MIYYQVGEEENSIGEDDEDDMFGYSKGGFSKGKKAPMKGKVMWKICMRIHTKTKILLLIGSCCDKAKTVEKRKKYAFLQCIC